MTNYVLERAKRLLGTDYKPSAKQLTTQTQSLARAKDVLSAKGGLDVYLVFDTTGSMSSYIDEVRRNIGEITDVLLGSGSSMKLSVNGVGDHCDRDNVMQMYALTGVPEEVYGSIENIVMTDGGDTPEAYECLALAMAKRMPVESPGRKKAVVLIGDSYPHGMQDAPCIAGVDYESAFEAMKTVCDGFYLVGCEQANYGLQRKLINPARKEHEQFIPLGSMVGTLPQLLIALAKKTESEKAFVEFLKSLEARDAVQAGKIRGLLR